MTTRLLRQNPLRSSPAAVDDPSNEFVLQNLCGAHWPIVREQRLWLAFLEDTVEVASRPWLGALCTEARDWICGRTEIVLGGVHVSFAVVCDWVSIGSKNPYNPRALRKQLKRLWRRQREISLRREHRRGAGFE